MQKIKKMIQQQTVLKVVDNSGARRIKCIKVLGGFKRQTAFIGDIIVASVQQLRSKNRYLSKIRKGDVVKALVIKTKSWQKKKDGSFTIHFENTAVLINKKGNLIGTRILSAVPKTLKKKKLLKYVSFGRGTV